MATGLTSEGYWALLHEAGIEQLYRLPKSDNWMARNRDDEKFTVRDPYDLTPVERQDAADYFIGIYGS